MSVHGLELACAKVDSERFSVETQQIKWHAMSAENSQLNCLDFEGWALISEWRLSVRSEHRNRFRWFNGNHCKSHGPFVKNLLSLFRPTDFHIPTARRLLDFELYQNKGDGIAERLLSGLPFPHWRRIRLLGEAWRSVHLAIRNYLAMNHILLNVQRKDFHF